MVIVRSRKSFGRIQAYTKGGADIAKGSSSANGAGECLARFESWELEEAIAQSVVGSATILQTGLSSVCEGYVAIQTGLSSVIAGHVAKKTGLSSVMGRGATPANATGLIVQRNQLKCYS